MMEYHTFICCLLLIAVLEPQCTKVSAAMAREKHLETENSSLTNAFSASPVTRKKSVLNILSNEGTFGAHNSSTNETSQEIEDDELLWHETDNNPTEDSWKGNFDTVFYSELMKEPTSVPLTTKGGPISNTKSFSTTTTTTTRSSYRQTKSPVFSRVLFDPTLRYLPPVYHPQDIVTESVNINHPMDYSSEVKTTGVPYYHSIRSSVTEKPVMTSAPYYAIVKPSNVRNAAIGKSYGGSGGSSASSYGGMGTSTGGAGMGSYESSYGNSYGNVKPAAGGMMYGSMNPSAGMMYGGGGGASAMMPHAPYGTGAYGTGAMMPHAPYGTGAMMMPPTSYAKGAMMTPASYAGGNYMPTNGDSGMKGFINKLLALLPFGLLMAVALPSLVVVPSRRSLMDDTPFNASVIKMDNKLLESYPILEMINFYGIESLHDNSCLQYILCKTVRLGSQQGANVFQKQLWNAINWMNNTITHSLGMEGLRRAILEDECATFVCRHKNGDAELPISSFR